MMSEESLEFLDSQTGIPYDRGHGIRVHRIVSRHDCFQRAF